MIKKYISLLWKKESRLPNLTLFLTALWIFLIPFGKGEKAPVALLAILGAFRLARNKMECVKSLPAKSFLLLLTLYLTPVAISLLDAVSFSAPFKILLIGLGSGLAGIAIIHAAETTRMFLPRISALFACVVGFWFLDAGIQALFGRDIFGMVWEQGRLSGPWIKKTQMGYYSGPFSASLLIFALQKKWKPAYLCILFIFMSVIVLLNNSRGGWVMYGIVAAVFCWQAFIAPRKHRVLVCTGLITLGIVMLSSLYLSSNTFQTRTKQTLVACSGDKHAINEASSGRLPIWEAACKIIQTHPINGIGARNFRKIASDYWPTGYDTEMNVSYPHQYILEYAVGTGVIGLVGLAGFLTLCIRWWNRATAEQKQNAAGVGLTLLALYFPFNTHKAYFGSELSISLWVLIALYVAAIRGTNKPATKLN